jgi:His/Glu/Gln/Arg/opine family amino acid ABC transporter permease subunit
MGEFDFSVWGPSLPFIRDGLLFTLRLTLIAMSGGIVIGTLLALARLSPVKPLSLAAGAYVDTMRSIPLVMVILWFFLVIPFSPARRSAPRPRRSSPSPPSRRPSTARSCAPASRACRAARSGRPRRWA